MDDVPVWTNFLSYFIFNSKTSSSYPTFQKEKGGSTDNEMAQRVAGNGGFVAQPTSYEKYFVKYLTKLDCYQEA